MIVGQWIVRTPEPHEICAEWRFIEGDLTLSVDGIVQLSRTLGTGSEETDQIDIDGVSYTLTRSLPLIGFPYDLVKTADLPRPPHVLRQRRDLLGRAIVGLVLIPFCFITLLMIQADMNGSPYASEFEPVFRWARVFCLVALPVGYIRLAYRWRKVLRSQSTATSERSPSTEGAPPRSGAYFRPLLADIAAAAVRWKGRIYGRCRVSELGVRSDAGRTPSRQS